MKTILRLLLVACLFTILVNEPPKPVQAEVKGVQVIKAVAPKVTDTRGVAPTDAPILTPVPVEIYHSDDFYKEYIFTKESNGRLAAVNEINCKGLGQDCNGQLDKDCPNWQTDLLCQLGFWDRYAIARYGSWANAYAFRVSHNWW